MLFKSNLNKNDSARIDMTPIIDVVFLLLIFFMLTSSFILQPGIKVEVPKAKKSNVLDEQEYVITISKEGNVYFQEKQVKIYNLFPLLEKNFKNKTDSVLIIKADKRVQHGRVVNVMDIAKQANIKKIAISTEPK